MYPSSINNGFEPQIRTSLSGSYYNNESSNYTTPSPHIPLEDEAVYCDFFQSHQLFWNGDNYDNNNLILPQEMITTNEESPMGECSYNNNNNNNGQVSMNDFNNIRVDEHQISSTSRMKMMASNKRDRHSKIITARGPRDRRMRLSLDVAKKLFGLQDLLGFDKASKTVDWLLTKSKTAILELLPDVQSCIFMDVCASSTSECEVVSGTGDQSVDDKGTTGDDDQEITKNKVNYSSGNIKNPKDRITRRCADFHHPVAKASRQRARERARERTLLKKYNKPIDQLFGSWSVGEFDQISSSFQFQQGHFVADNSSLLMTGNWSPSYSFNIPQSSGQTHEMVDKAWDGNI